MCKILHVHGRYVRSDSGFVEFVNQQRVGKLSRAALMAVCYINVLDLCPFFTDDRWIVHCTVVVPLGSGIPAAVADRRWKIWFSWKRG